MHFENSWAKISANSGVDQGCPLSAGGFAADIDPVTTFALAELRRLLDGGARLFTSLDDWHVWIKPLCLPDAIALLSATTCSVNLELQPSKNSNLESVLYRPSIAPDLLDKVKPTINCLGGHFHIQGHSEPRPICSWRAIHHGPDNTQVL